MPSSTDQEAELRAAAEEIVLQGWLRFLDNVPTGRVRLKAREVAVALGYQDEQSVYNELLREDTWLEVEQSDSAALKRVEKWITARSVKLTLARRAMAGGMIAVRGGRPQKPLFLERLLSVLDECDKAQLDAVLARAGELRRKMR